MPGAATAGMATCVTKPFIEVTRTVVPVGDPSQRMSTHCRGAKPVPRIVRFVPGTALPNVDSVAEREPAPTDKSGKARAGRSTRIGMVARMSRVRRRRWGRAGALAAPSSTQRVPFQNIDIDPFGDPADYESPVALRPRLATGVPFRGDGAWDIRSASMMRTMRLPDGRGDGTKVLWRDDLVCPVHRRVVRIRGPGAITAPVVERAS